MSNLVNSKSPIYQDCDLPNYIVKESNKAKYLRLKVSVEKGLEVIIPKGYDRKLIPEILHKKKSWLEKATKSIEEKRHFFNEQSPHLLPDRLTLQAINEEWEIEYLKIDFSSSEKFTIKETEGHKLIIQGNIGDVEACRYILQKWLNQKAYKHLVPWLQKVSTSHQLKFQKASVRGQKTRWASCSNRHTISLNYKLLFLPASVVNYVFIHELCHTIHLNHSASFWNLVETKEPNYKILDTELSHAWRIVPAWLEP